MRSSAPREQGPASAGAAAKGLLTSGPQPLGTAAALVDTDTDGITREAMVSIEQFLDYLHTSPATARLAESLADLLALRGCPALISVEVAPSLRRLAG